MILDLQEFFKYDDYVYLKNHLTKIKTNIYRLSVDESFFIKHDNSIIGRTWFTDDEKLKLINERNWCISWLLYSYQKLGIIQQYKLCSNKTEEQEKLFERHKGVEHWDFTIRHTFFDYELTLSMKKLIFCGDLIFENKKYRIASRYLNQLIDITNSIRLTWNELIDYLGIIPTSKHYYKNLSLIIYSISEDESLIDRLFVLLTQHYQKWSETYRDIQLLQKNILSSKNIKNDVVWETNKDYWKGWLFQRVSYNTVRVKGYETETIIITQQMSQMLQLFEKSHSWVTADLQHLKITKEALNKALLRFNAIFKWKLHISKVRGETEWTIIGQNRTNT